MTVLELFLAIKLQQFKDFLKRILRNTLQGLRKQK